MNKPIITVENLSKRYHLGQIGATTLRDSVERFILRLRGLEHGKVIGYPFSVNGKKTGDGLASGSTTNYQQTISNIDAPLDDLWALKDVSFEVLPGEVLGIIGRNGAGKSTLLKILSRITEPTSGRAIVRGRIASLLEVGTGFHPELTGRENIFLNGAILGMKKTEIARKFDEIVGFSEVERFIDTPVKRYSSGMYVRLAFAVAAHLEPEILVVDEVLAVGDAEFQSKCLGKMGAVAKGGRTVLFVSHNMQAIQSLCQSVLILQSGRIVASGLPELMVPQYLSGLGSGKKSYWSSEVGMGDHGVKLVGLKTFTGAAVDGAMRSSHAISIQLDVKIERMVPGLCVGFDLFGRDGAMLLRSYDTDVESIRFRPLVPGFNSRRCVIPAGTLNAGRYFVAPRIGVHNQCWIMNGDPLVSFDVILDHGKSPYWNILDASNRPGLVAPILDWQ